MTVGKRFKEFRKTLKKTQQNVADVLGCRQSNVNMYEKDEISPPIKTLKIIRNAFNVNIDWLLFGEGDMFMPASRGFSNPNDIKQKVFTLLRNEFSLLETGEANLDSKSDAFWYFECQGEIACGDPIPFEQELSDNLIPISKRILHSPHDVDILRVNGDSMMPDIEHGDLLIIKKEYNWDACRNKIVAVKNDEGLTLKKLVIDERKRSAMLIPSNKNYYPIMVDESCYLCGYLLLLVRYY